MNHTTTDSDAYDSDGKVKPTKRLLTPFLSKNVPPYVTDEEKRKPLPYNTKNWFSRLFFLWLIPLLNIGYKRTLEPMDLWELNEEYSMETIYARFEENLQKERAVGRLNKVSLLKVLLKTFRWNFAKCIILISVGQIAEIFIPVLIKNLVELVRIKISNPSSSMSTGVGYSIGIMLLLMVKTLCVNHTSKNSHLLSTLSNSVLTKAILIKSMNASKKTNFDHPRGKVFSLVSNDLAKLGQALVYGPMLLTVPIPIIIGIILLIVIIGVSALAGIGVLLLLFIFLTIPVTIQIRLKNRVNKFTDKRVGLIREVLNSLKMIKFYSWEKSYEKLLHNVRQSESSLIFRIQLAINSMLSFVVCLPNLSSMVTFLVQHFTQPGKSIGSIFGTLSLFNVLSGVMTDLPMHLSFAISGFISLSRISEYLESSEEEIRDDVEVLKEKHFFKGDDEYHVEHSIDITDGEFQWDNFTNDEIPFSLQHVNLSIQKGEFIVIVGTVGSGKSSLLSAIAQKMNKVKGEVEINGSFIFYDQPWIQNATVRDNITFGLPFDIRKFDRIVNACSLNVDLQALSQGDLTEIGERGVTLSGGQRARINLARSLYAERDIYLLDDVLSAVDANVGKHIMNHCMMDLLSTKTRVLATHQLALIHKADRIIFMDKNGRLDIGSFDELFKCNDRFVSFIRSSKDSPTNVNQLQKILTSTKEQIDASERNADTTIPLFNDEEREINSIPFKIYKRYIRAGEGPLKWLMHPIILILILSGTFATLFSNIWLSFWVGSRFTGKSQDFYIGIYVAVVLSSILILFIEATTVGFLTIQSSKTLSIKAMNRVLYSPMKFIETTPFGRILNRLTNDITTLDFDIIEEIKITIHLLFISIGILIMCFVYLPWFMIAVLPLAALFTATINYYQASAREVKRLEAITRSFIYNNFNEVLTGVETIKMYNAKSMFIAKNDFFTNKFNEAYLVTVANRRWIGIMIDFTAAILSLIISVLSASGKFNINASSAGLLLSSFLQLTTSLTQTFISFTEFENDMNSVERVCQYAFEIEQEGVYSKLGFNQSFPDWPQRGDLEFNDVCLKYGEKYPLVLRNISFKIPHCSKVGICGRTGSGKSSLIAALYRLCEISQGCIEIDSVNIGEIGLNDLRSKLSIIPQDPVLFQGNIRKNLDPFDEYPDHVLCESLEKCGLDSYDGSKKFQLESVVEDEGLNYSLGERQLISLVRAMVRRSKILIMDEATSSVDLNTDLMIQKIIMEEFKDVTILCIAHRLETIKNYDKIIVMDNGEICEFDTPLNLYNKKGKFREMCDVSGLRNVGV